LLLALLAGYAIFQVVLIPRLPLTYDEGISLQVAYLIERGYEPYTQIFTLANPLFVSFVGLLGKAGLPPNGFKVIFLTFSLLLLANTAIIGRSILGAGSGLAAAFMLATATTFVAGAADVLAVLPALSLATLALVFTVRYLETNRLFWLVLSAVVWVVALFFSTTVFSLGFMVIVFLLFLKPAEPNIVVLPAGWRTVTVPVAAWLLTTLIAIGLGIALATPAIIFDYVLGSRALISANIPLIQAGNFSLIGQFIFLNSLFFLAVIYGLARIDSVPNHALWLVVIWILLGFGWLMLRPAPRPAELAILLPPLAIIAGWSVVDIWQRLVDRHRPSSRNQRLVWLAMGTLLLVIYLSVGWRQLNSFIFQDIDTRGSLVQLNQRPQIIDFIRQHTDANDCVIIDDAALAVAANRLPAPELVELSQVRVGAGLITESELAELLVAHQCTAVVFSKREYSFHLRKFNEWVQANFPNEQEFSRTKIYYR
jgi:hypothetical protein